MSEFDRLYGDEFFIIDSNNLNLINENFYGYAIQNNYIIQKNNFINNQKISHEGAYVYVQSDDEKISISQDFIGAYGLYLYHVDDFFVISNSFIKLVEYLKEYTKLSFNKQYADAFLFADLCSYAFGETLVNEISLIPRNCKIIINKLNKSLHFEFIDYEENSVDINSQQGIEILDKWYNKWVDIFRFLKSKTNNITVDLSGGFDSRIVAAIWLTADIDLDKIFIKSNKGKGHTFEEDYRIASEIANEFNYKLNNDVTRNNYEYFQEVNTILNKSFYLKLGFHKEMYFRYTRSIEELYSFTGSAGETIRGYPNQTVNEYLNEVINLVKRFDENLEKSTEKTVLFAIDKIKEKFDLNNQDASIIPEKLYKEIRSRHHYGKALVESYFSNTFTFTPLIDEELHKLKLDSENCHDRRLLMAVIYQRYCPKLLDFDFEGNRGISYETIEFAKQINKKYPFVKKQKEFISGPKITEIITNNVPNDNYVKWDEVNDFLSEVFFSHSFEMEFKKYYSKKAFDKISEVVKTQGRFPLKHVYSAIAILKIIYDTGYNLIDNHDLNSFLKSFINNNDFDFNDEYLDMGTINLLMKYNTARLDILNEGSKDNTVKIIEYDDSNMINEYPKWFQSNNGKGLRIESFKGSLNLTLSCVNGGKIRLRLRAPDIRDKNGNRFPIFVDYTKLKINGKCYIENNVLVSHDNVFDIYFNVKDSEIINISCEWLPFNSQSSYE